MGRWQAMKDGATSLYNTFKSGATTVGSVLSTAGRYTMDKGKAGYGIASQAAGGIGMGARYAPAVAGLRQAGGAARMAGRGMRSMFEGGLLGGRKTASGNLALKAGMGELGQARSMLGQWARGADFARHGKWAQRGVAFGRGAMTAGGIAGGAWGVSKMRGDR
jgi:hypothetical protein